MTNVLEMLEESAKKYPNKIAFKDEYNEMSFSKLLELSKRGGSCLKNGAIAIHMKKSCAALSVMLSAVQAGGFYSIIDLDLPVVRKRKICDTLMAATVVCDDELLAESKEIFIGYEVLSASSILTHTINQEKLKQTRNNHISTDVLYCNFTSGSTGDPKGILISHASVIDFIAIFTKTLNLKHTDILANQAPFDFDVSVKDIYSTLYLGAQTLLIPRQYFTKPIDLINFIESATIYIWAVSALIFLNKMKVFSYKIPKIRKIIYSGEIMPNKHLIKLKEYLPNTEFINVYGPSEITCNCTFHILKNKDLAHNEHIIGTPFANRRVLLRDENENIIKEHMKIGEICVSGICLSIGYINHDNSSFYQDSKGQRFYKTGDLAFYNKDGLLCIKGRKDFQIKRMGHRIELNEIETIAQQCKEVSRACAIYANDKLNLFFEGDQDEINLSKFLRQNLPYYMLPNAIIKKDTLNITKNGKIDRKALHMELHCEK